MNPVNVLRPGAGLLLKLTDMAQQKKNKTNTAGARSPLPSFRKRYDEAEANREKLIARLSNLSTVAAQHPGYRRARKLLNDAFRQNSLTQRVAILQAAAWLIDVLEQVTLSI